MYIIIIEGWRFKKFIQIAPGAIYAGQRIRFLRPVIVGDTVTAVTTVKSFVENKPHIALCSTQCFNQHHEKVIDGTATVHLPWLVEPLDTE